MSGTVESSSGWTVFIWYMGIYIYIFIYYRQHWPYCPLHLERTMSFRGGRTVHRLRIAVSVLSCRYNLKCLRQTCMTCTIYDKCTSQWLLITVDQLMWRTIVHHIPRWREPSPLRDFMVRLWPFTLWNVDCLHVNWLISCVRIAGSVVFVENNAHPFCIVDDKIPLGCGGRQTRVTRMMWWTIIWDVGDDICLWMYLIL